MVTVNSLEGDGEQGILSRGVLLGKALPRRAEALSWANRALKAGRKARPGVASGRGEVRTVPEGPHLLGLTHQEPG